MQKGGGWVGIWFFLGFLSPCSHGHSTAPYIPLFLFLYKFGPWLYAKVRAPSPSLVSTDLLTSLLTQSYLLVSYIFLLVPFPFFF